MFRLASVLVLVSACALAACEGDAGAAGDVSLVRIEAEPKGENCPFGGTRIMSGLDLDRDGVLSDDEAGPAQYVCDGLGTRVDDIWEGHFIAAGPIDLMLLAEIRHITGDLFIEEAFYRTVNLPKLETVEGDLWVINNNFLESVDLSGLKSVYGEMHFGENAFVVSADFSSLAEVGETLGIGRNNSLKTVAFPELTSVGSFLHVNSNDSLESFHFPKLKSIGDRIKVSSSTALSAISFPMLETVEDYISMRDNISLLSISLPELASVGARFEVVNNRELESLVAPKLKSATSIQVFNNVKLPVCHATNVAAQITPALDPGQILTHGNDDVSTDACP